MTVAAALDWADVTAMLGDFGEAVAWLDLVEAVKGSLSPRLVAKRRLWAERAQARVCG